jgi:hypothetical protein
LKDLSGADGPFTPELPNRRAFILASATGALYIGWIEAKLSEIKGLPAIMLEEPVALLLTATDRLHDGVGGAVFDVIEAVLRHPRMSVTKVEAAKRIRQNFTPARKVFRESYPDEASRAKKNRLKIAALEADLRLISVPHPERDGETQTLYEWVDDFISQGEKLDELLSLRAGLTPQALEEAMTKANVLRAEAIGLLGEFRKILSRELSTNVALPRNMDAVIFGYLDDLEAQRARSAAASSVPSRSGSTARGATTTPSETTPTEPQPS